MILYRKPSVEEKTDYQALEKNDEGATHALDREFVDRDRVRGPGVWSDTRGLKKSTIQSMATQGPLTVRSVALSNRVF